MFVIVKLKNLFLVTGLRFMRFKGDFFDIWRSITRLIFWHNEVIKFYKTFLCWFYFRIIFALNLKFSLQKNSQKHLHRRCFSSFLTYTNLQKYFSFSTFTCWTSLLCWASDNWSLAAISWGLKLQLTKVKLVKIWEFYRKCRGHRIMKKSFVTTHTICTKDTLTQFICMNFKSWISIEINKFFPFLFFCSSIIWCCCKTSKRFGSRELSRYRFRSGTKTIYFSIFAQVSTLSRTKKRSSTVRCEKEVLIWQRNVIKKWLVQKAVDDHITHLTLVNQLN